MDKVNSEAVFRPNDQDPNATDILTPFTLDERQLDIVARTVPGGLDNLQDIYPLSSLQEGMLFHHLLEDQTESYVICALVDLESRAQMIRFVRAFQDVVARHDILRSAVLWEGLPQPVQIVCKHALLVMDEFTLESDRCTHLQIEDLLHTTQPKWDLRRAPLIRIEAGADPHSTKWYAILRLHHIICDHQSLKHAIAETIIFMEDRAAELATPLPYRAYLRRALAKARPTQAERFFCEKLRDVEEPTAPFGVLGINDKNGRIQQVRESIAGDLSGRIRACASSLGVSPARLFHAAWALVVAKTAGRNEALFGTVLLTEPPPNSQTRCVLGMAVNTLPLRLDLRNATAKQLVEQTHEELWDLLRYGQTSLPLAQRCSGIIPPMPLFTALLNYRHGGWESEADTSKSAAVRVLSYGDPRTNYPVVLLIDELIESFVLTAQTAHGVDPFRLIEYTRTAIFSLIEALLNSPDKPVLALSILPESERQRVVKLFNPPEEPRHRHGLVHERFEEQVEHMPEAISVMFEGHSLSYAELNARANRLARFLLEREVGPDQLVGICVEPGLDLVVGLLGILKAGGAYVPLDPSYPPERLAYMLDDATPRIVLIQERLRASLPHTTAAMIALDSDADEITQQSPENPDSNTFGLRSDHLAYVIYTSGSTGKPKGVMVDHANVSRLFEATHAWFKFTEEDVWTLFHSFAFDFSVWELWGALLYGARLVVVPRLTARSSLEFYRLLCMQGVTILNQTPSAFSQLIDAQNRNTESRHSLRLVIFGGEALELHMLRPWVARNGADRPQLVNMYGITETTVHVTYRPLTADEIESERSSVIGTPIPDLRAYLLDPHGQTVPIGVTGELYIGGAGVARGYLNRPDLTAERFVADSFANSPAARVYRTGDLGRWRPDGVIEYLGRIDHQVKIRGFRIELGEIETQLMRHGLIKEAVVVAHADATGGKRLIAYAVAENVTPNAPTLNAETLRSYLKQTLPEYMVPSAYVLLDQLPLTPNGKLDRRALPAPELADYASRQYAAPEGDAERTLAAIWRTLLRIERVGRNDNFFELGGHSLLILRMLEQLRSTGRTTDVRRIFENPILKDMAAALRTEGVQHHRPPPGSIPSNCEAIAPSMLPFVVLNAEHIDRIERTIPGAAGNIQDIYPLTPLQEGILFHHLRNRGGVDPYARQIVLSVGSLEKVRHLAAALQSVIDRHDILRTAVLWQGLPRPVQIVHRHALLTVEELKLAPNRDPIEQLKDWAASDKSLIDLSQAPPLQLLVAADTAGSKKCYVLLKTHHIVCDNESFDILVSETRSFLDGGGQDLPPAVPYRNYVEQALAFNQVKQTEGFFRNKLANIHETTAPFGLLDVHGDGTRTEAFHQTLDGTLSSAIRQNAARLGVSPATLFHAAWGLVVARTSGRDDVVFGSVLLGRLNTSAAALGCLGMFVNTLPLRLSLRHATARGLVEHTRRELADLFDHEQAPLAMAQQCSGILPPQPLFTALLNYRHKTSTQKRDWGDGIEIHPLNNQERTNYPIVASVDDSGEGFSLTLQTDSQVPARLPTLYFVQALQSLIEALENAPERPALALAMLPKFEHCQVIEVFNKTTRSFPSDKLIHQLFEAQVERAPDAVALIYENEALTYLELNRRANRLARHLISHGVKIGDTLPILLPRGLLMLVIQLAVLKSGAAYLPIDVQLPVERQAFMIRDTRAQLVLRGRSVYVGFESISASWIDCESVSHRLTVNKDCNVKLPVSLEFLTHSIPAYVMYTSGSTGLPKGVVVPHQAVIRLVINSGFAEIGPTDCIAHCSNPAFDASTFEIWGGLLNGARVTIAPEKVVMSPVDFVTALKQSQVTVLWLTAGLFAQYSEALANVIGQIKYLLTGGDVVEPASVRRATRHSQPQHLLNGYGPTECTTFATTYEILSASTDSTAIPIGRPIANTRVYILDGHLQPVPLGVGGEICVGGAGVACGYLDRPDLTAERFVPDPFSSNPAARIYRTGDLGRWRPEGVIEYLGRIDQQVKIRGFRIELGEIETQLTRHERVKDAAVIARGDVPGEKRLVAYVVPSDDTSGAPPLNAETLRFHLKQTLPEYMVPGAYVLLEHLPLTPNGKLDRRALPPPGLAAYASRQYEAPEGDVERTLTAMWQTLLRIEQVGRNDNFFELGGHSLLALQTISRINESFDSALTLADLYRNPTILQLAEVICGKSAIDRFVDLLREAHLPEEMRPQSSLRTASPGYVLLTGGVGFVGRFLLAQLLQETHRTIYCLVRSGSPQHARSRIKATLSKWNLWKDELEKRIVPIAGDLSLPRLGLDDASYEVLCERIDEIYHCATSMNHLETYAMAKPTNVFGTKEIIKLALHNSKRLHYISTLSVFSNSDRRNQTVNEDSSVDAEKHSSFEGYAASKWVGERMVVTAAERGIPCNIFRLGLVWADTEQGRYDELQREYRILKSSFLSGLGIANYRFELAPTPVDYVAQAVVFLASHHADGRNIFHISSSRQGINGIFERCNEIVGTSLELLPFPKWVSEMKRMHREGQSLPVVPLIEALFAQDEQALFANELGARRDGTRFDCTKTQRELEVAGIPAPVLDDDLLKLQVEYMLSMDEDLRRHAYLPKRKYA